jgi:hypothetical protein
MVLNVRMSVNDELERKWSSPVWLGGIKENRHKPQSGLTGTEPIFGCGTLDLDSVCGSCKMQKAQRYENRNDNIYQVIGRSTELKIKKTTYWCISHFIYILNMTICRILHCMYDPEAHWHFQSFVLFSWYMSNAYRLCISCYIIFSLQGHLQLIFLKFTIFQYFTFKELCNIHFI